MGQMEETAVMEETAARAVTARMEPPGGMEPRAATVKTDPLEERAVRVKGVRTDSRELPVALAPMVAPAQPGVREQPVRTEPEALMEQTESMGRMERRVWPDQLGCAVRMDRGESMVPVALTVKTAVTAESVTWLARMGFWRIPEAFRGATAAMAPMAVPVAPVASVVTAVPAVPVVRAELD